MKEKAKEDLGFRKKRELGRKRIVYGFCDWNSHRGTFTRGEDRDREQQSTRDGRKEEGWLRASCRDTVELQFFILEEESNKKKA